MIGRRSLDQNAFVRKYRKYFYAFIDHATHISLSYIYFFLFERARQAAGHYKSTCHSFLPHIKCKNKKKDYDVLHSEQKIKYMEWPGQRNSGCQMSYFWPLSGK